MREEENSAPEFPLMILYSTRTTMLRGDHGRQHWRERSRWHERYEDWLAELKAIIEHEAGDGRKPRATTPSPEDAWRAGTRPWDHFSQHISIATGVSIDDISVLGEDDE